MGDGLKWLLKEGGGRIFESCDISLKNTPTSHAVSVICTCSEVDTTLGIVAMGTVHGTCTQFQMTFTGLALELFVLFVLLLSTADRNTGRLCLLLTASNSCHCITRAYLIQLSVTSAGFQRNKRCPRIVAAQKCAAEEIVAAVSD